MLSTADLCDSHSHEIHIAEPLLRSFGGKRAFSGPIETVRTLDDNSLVRAALEEQGAGRVLVVDGGGSLRCALLGDQLAALAIENGWAGVIVFGCIRDSALIANMQLGVFALNTHPLKSQKRGVGERNVPVHFAGIDFLPGHFVYADDDGILASPNALDK